MTPYTMIPQRIHHRNFPLPAHLLHDPCLIVCVPLPIRTIRFLDEVDPHPFVGKFLKEPLRSLNVGLRLRLWIFAKSVREVLVDTGQSFMGAVRSVGHVPGALGHAVVNIETEEFGAVFVEVGGGLRLDDAANGLFVLFGNSTRIGTRAKCEEETGDQSEGYGDSQGGFHSVGLRFYLQNKRNRRLANTGLRRKHVQHGIRPTHRTNVVRLEALRTGMLRLDRDFPGLAANPDEVLSLEMELCDRGVFRSGKAKVRNKILDRDLLSTLTVHAL